MHHCHTCPPPACEQPRTCCEDQEQVANQKRREQRNKLKRLALVAFDAWHCKRCPEALAKAMHELKAATYF